MLSEDGETEGEEEGGGAGKDVQDGGKGENPKLGLRTQEENIKKRRTFHSTILRETLFSFIKPDE